MYCFKPLGTNHISKRSDIISAYTGKLTSKYRLRTAYKTDERVRLTEEIISGMQVIKMYAWEKPFAKMVEIARK